MARYFVTGEGQFFEREVSKEDYVRAERAAGFHNTMGQPDEPATHSWSNSGTGTSGRIDD